MNNEIAKRKNNRLQGYSYSENGIYFLTICSKDKAKIFGEVVGDGVLDVPKTQLSNYGKIVEEILLELDRHYQYITVDKYVIMPNHVHLLLTVMLHNGTSRTPSPTNAVVPSFISTWKRFSNKRASVQLFQRSYHDHVVRNEADFLACWKYIDENPVKWQEDELYMKE